MTQAENMNQPPVPPPVQRPRVEPPPVQMASGGLAGVGDSQREGFSRVQKVILAAVILWSLMALGLFVWESVEQWFSRTNRSLGEAIFLGAVRGGFKLILVSVPIAALTAMVAVMALVSERRR